MPGAGFALLSDFDGTITKEELSNRVLEDFAIGDYKIYDLMLENGEISLEECVRRQFSLVGASEEAILASLEQGVTFRPNFGILVKHCLSREIPLIVVSAGLDFVIRRFLERQGWLGHLKLRAGKARAAPSGMSITFPKKTLEESHNFKDDLVRLCKKRNNRVIYIGDGLSDIEAAKEADMVFCVRDSKLSSFCRQKWIPFSEFMDFREVVSVLEGLNA